MLRGFWGLKVSPGKTYSQTVDASFRVSNAALGESIINKERTSVILTVDDKSFVLCSLTPNSVEQQQLDIHLTEGEEISFETNGKNEIHLTGNFIDDEIDDSDDDDESGDDDDEQSVELDNLSPEELQELISQGLINTDDLEMDDSEGDEDYDSEDAEADSRIEELPSDLEEGDEVDEDEEEELREEILKIKNMAQEKKDKKDKKRKQEEQEEAAAEKAKKAKKEKKEKKEKKPKTTQLPGGLLVEDKKEGDGPVAKKGKRIGMYYIGKLTSGKVFDQNTKGKPFWFRLGAGEVIRGWDSGIVGMKQGGERRLTIPAAMAYGKRGAPPDIPPNATLVFDIRMVSMK